MYYVLIAFYVILAMPSMTMNILPPCIVAPKTTFHDACARGDRDAVKHYIEWADQVKWGVDKEAELFDGIWSAVSLGHYSTVELLLDSGRIDINKKGLLSGSTLLHIAACAPPFQEELESYHVCTADLQAFKNIIDLLLDKKADINAMSFYDMTPLSCAVHRFAAMVPCDMTPLSRAAYRQALEIIELLISKKPKIITKDRDDRTPLFYAALSRNKHIIELFSRIDDAQVQSELQKEIAWRGHCEL